MRVPGPARGLLAAALATGALMAPGAAVSARTLVEVGGTATPPIVAFTTTPQTLDLALDFRFTSDVPDELPGTVARSTIYFPHGPRVNGALFPSCDAAELRRKRGQRSACPSGSRLGGGTALGSSPQFGAGIRERLRVDIYNAKRGRGLLLYLQGLNPVFVSGIIEASLTPLRGGRWGYRLSLRVPPQLQEISPSIFASLLRFTVSVGGSVRVREHGRMVRRGYIEALACPPGALVPVRAVFGFNDGSTATDDNYIACGHR